MKNFKFYLTFICTILVLLPLQAQKINFEKGNEFSDKMLAPNAKQLVPSDKLAPTPVKRKSSLLRSLRAAGQPESLDLGDGLHLLPDNLDPESSVVSATITSDQMANLPAIRGDLFVSISNRIYEKFNDDFDFLFFVLDKVDWSYADALGELYGENMGISNDVTGLGFGTYSNVSTWGSGGKLKSAIFFPSSSIVGGPFLHEICHNWAAYICPTYAPDNSSYEPHWGVSNAGGQLGGFKYVRVVEKNSGGVPGKTLYQASMYSDTNPDGSFTKPGFGTNANYGNTVPYSDIELYLMGMKSAQELRDADFHLDIYSGNDYNYDGEFSFTNGYFYSTTKTSYTIDNIIALDGERIPDAAASQKQFKALTVVITEEDSIPRSAYNIVTGLQYLSGYPENGITQNGYNFSQATNGIGSLVTSDVKNSLKSFVGADVTGVSLDMTTVSLPVNTIKRLIATVLPSNARNKNVHWSSSNESVAAVSATGLITAVSEGETTITVTTEDGGFSATCTVTVIPALSDSEIFEVTDGVLVAYHGSSGDVVIPDNLGITKIGTAFITNSTITSVSIPEGVTQIMDYAFNYCSGLTSITFPNSLETIGDYAFNMCTGLISITIPNSVKTIGTYAFTGLFTSINIIPKSVETIGDLAFGSSILTSIQVDAENPAYSSEDGVLYNKDKTVLCQYPGGKSGTAFNIPNSVEAIGNGAFTGSNLISITIPNSVKSIGDHAFQVCQELTSIMIPNSVEIIGVGVFSTCVKLTSIDVDAENPVYLSEDGILYNKDKTVLYQYPAGKSETAFDIPNTVKTIGNDAFDKCSNLTSITIPNSITEIGESAFLSCKFTSITIPSSVKSIGNGIFAYCDELRDIAVHWKTPPNINGKYGVLGGLYNLYAITLHVPYGTKALYEATDGWKEFGAIVEQEPVSATGVSLDKTSLSLVAGNTAQLTATVLPEDVDNSNLSWSSSNPGIATVSDNGLVTAQAAGTATITVTTQDGNFTATCVITVINGVSIGSFSGGSVSADKAAPTAGETVTLTISPDAGYELDIISAYKVGDGTTVVETLHATSLNTYEFVMPEYGVTVTATFYNLSDFEVINGVLVAYHGTGGDVVIPSNLGITKIGAQAFSYYTNITSLSIPEGITQILDLAFEYCQGLTSITIPGSVTSIGNNIFSSCIRLASIQVDAENPVYSSEDGVLYNKDKTTLYMYPIGKSETAFDIPNTVKTIRVYAFTSCSNLTSITIPNSVTEIDNGAFLFCDKLRNIAVHWKTPPTIGTLGGLNLSDITLHVPYGTKALYEAADVWKEFGAIVEQEPLSVTGVSLDETSLSLSVGNTAQLTATVLPEDAANSNLSWSSNNTGVATVSDNGLVTAQAAGTATITVTTHDGNFTATCVITVTAIPTYGVSVGTFSGGSVSANKTAVEADETVTLTITPDTGYELDAISAYKTDDETTTVVLSGSGDARTFAMPEYGVTVTATFRNPNAEAVATAKSIIEGMSSITVTQAAANTETAVKSWLATQINALAGMSATGITVSETNITISGFNAAAEGTTGTPAGSNGSFNFTVSLTKGSSNSTTTSKVGTITATAYVYQNYTVTIAATTNGSVSVSPGTSVKETETVTLTISPAEGYELDAILVCKTGDNTTTIVPSVPDVTTCTFTMPAFDVTITATFKKSQATLDAEAVVAAKTAIENASYTVVQATANTEDDVKSWLATQINALAGMSTTGITVSATNITISNFTAALSGVNGNFNFTVALTKVSATGSAAKSGTITATPVYTVTVAAATNGSVSADKTTAITQGETITLTILPAAGYELDAISAHKTGDNTTTIVLSVPDVTTRTFTMPAFDVTVTATFKKSQETLDAEAIVAAKTAIEDALYTVAQATANTETDVKTWLSTQINDLIASNDITVTATNITISNFTAAANGANGSFNFTVALTKGSATGSASKSGTISAIPVYSVTVATTTNGNVSASKITAITQGETITLTVSPDVGYELDAISAYKTGDNTTTIVPSVPDVTTRTFTMPAFDVTITATFKKSQATLDAEAIAAAKTAIEGRSYTVAQATANTETDVKAWLVTQINDLIASNDIIVTAANITLNNFTAASGGANGSFSFTIALAKVSATGSASKSGTISATPVYTLTVATAANGNVSASKTTAITQGETITLTITPDEGYELDAISAYKTGDNTTTIVLSVPDATTRTFTMPAYDVTVTATFKKSQATLDTEAIATAKTAIENRSYAVDQATANTDTGVKTWLATQINDLIASTGITVTAADITLNNFTAAAGGANGSFNFTVALALTKGSATGNAAKSGTISATAVYSVTVATTTNGNVSASKTTAIAQGETITLTVSPDVGYELDAISVYKTGDNTTTIVPSVPDVTTRTFTMPAYDVTVTATFKKSQATLDAEAVATAKTAIENRSYTVDQATANTETDVKVWLATQINDLIAPNDITVKAANITLNNFTAATGGANGSFSFTVALTKVSATGSASKSGTISATPVYTLTVSTAANGNVSASKTTAITQGETITLTVLPDTGYELDAISAYKTGEPATIVTLNVTGDTRTFTMPAFDVTITATFKKSQATLDTEAVTTAITAIEGRSYIVDQATANTDTGVKTWLATQIKDLIASTGITVTAANITLNSFTAATGGVNGSFNFTVALTKGSATGNAAKSGTISATAVYSVTVATTTNGNVSASKTTAIAQGETITLTITPDEGYELAAISAYKTGEESTIVVLNVPNVATRTFTMPEYGVTITVTFKKTQEQLDREAIETVKAAIEGGGYKVAQATGNTEADVKTWLVNTLNVLGVQFRSTASIIGDVTITAITQAVAGTEANPEGINGSFLFTVTLTKGETSLVTGDVPGVIIATPFTMVKSIDITLLDELTAHITNTGNVATGELTLALSGTNADAFTLSSTEVSNLAVGEETEITLTPRAELANGTYTATLTVNGEGLESKSIEITYSVTNVGNENTPQLKPLKAWIQNAMLHVNGLTAGKSWRVNNVSGVLVYQGIANGEQADIPLFVRGVYFVQSGNRTVKVVY